MAAFQIDKRNVWVDVDLKNNGVLVHCGAGVSRVIYVLIIVCYFGISIFD